jgi:hypothetical protein
LLLASNYFAFQVEMFEEEYEQNHRRVSEECSFAAPSLNWESFDKNNAPKAFKLEPVFMSEPLFFLITTRLPEFISVHPIHRVRDKSPPLPAVLTAVPA